LAYPNIITIRSKDFTEQQMMDSKEMEFEHVKNMQNNSLACLLVTLGSTISLAINPLSAIRIVFIIIGTFLSCFFFISYLNQHEKLSKIVRNTKREI
jgi:hypothetical protein